MAERIYEVSSRVESLAGLLWEVYKEAYGFRPRHLYEGWLNSSEESLLAELKSLEAEAELAAERWAEQEAYWEAEAAAYREAMIEIAASEKEYQAESLVSSSAKFLPFWA